MSMNNFSAYIKNTNGEYVKIEGKSAFTFSSSALLDERLDEAYLYTYNSPVETYKPTSEIRVDVTDGATTKSYYYIIATDRSQELPNGSGKYKHEIHLLERTKLLEGIYCQSLTFTNARGNVYTNNPLNVRPTQKIGAPPLHQELSDNDLKLLATDLIVTPLELHSQFSIPTPRQIFNVLASTVFSHTSIQLLDFVQQSTNEESRVYTGISFNNGGKSSSRNGTDASTIITVENPLIITYLLAIDSLPASSQGWAYEISFTVNAVSNQYPLKPWTVTDCINRCLDLAEPLFGGETPRYRLNPVQAEKYDKIRAPEISLTECTLHEQMKTVGGFIHAEPRLGGYAENGVYKEDWIFFDEYGIGEQAKIANKSYIYKAFSHDINEYCTHIETNASNVVNRLNYAQGVITDPNANNGSTIRTDSVNVMVTEGNGYADTQFKIYDIPNQIGGVFVSLYVDGGIELLSNIDITPYVFESHEYQNLSSYSDTYPYAKAFAVYYTRGERGIKGLFFKEENAVTPAFKNYAILNIINAVAGTNYKSGSFAHDYLNLAFKIKYIPIYDTKFSHSKQTVSLTDKPFSRVYNQSENLIETRWYGENVKGVAQRLGNTEQERTYLLKSLNDIPSIGEKIGEYFIAEVKCEIQPNIIKCQISLTKDFNRISQYVGISSNKRVFEVSENNAYTRDILIKNYIVISDASTEIEKGDPCIRSISPVRNLFLAHSQSQAPLTAVIGEAFEKNTNSGRKIVMPVISSAFGNTMVFSWDYKDNFSAGTKIVKNGVAYWQTDVPYSDYYGRAWWYKFYLYSSLANGGIDQARTVEFLGNIPSTDISTGDKYLLRKDSREILSFNYEIEFVATEQNIIVGSALANACELVSGTAYQENARAYFFDTEISKFGNSIEDLTDSVLVATTPTISVIDDTTMQISVTTPPGIENIKSWAILTPTTKTTQTVEDEDGNIEEIEIYTGGEVLVARNKAFTAGETDTIKLSIAEKIFN
jgi:hypothetical protein